MAKSKFLKSLLTTASAVAVLAGGAQSASAAVRTTTGAGGAVVIVQNTDSGAALSAALGVGDSIQLNHARDITTGGAITLAAPGINANGNTGQTFNVGHAVTWAGGTDLVDIALNVTGGGITIQDATTKAVTISGGAVVMRDALGAGANGRVTVTGGTLTINDANENMVVSGGVVTQAGTVAGLLNVTGTGKYLGAGGADITGAVVFNTNTVGNTFHDALAAATFTQGSVTFNDATGLVTVNGGTVTAMNDAKLGLTMSSGLITVMNDVTGADLAISGGTITAMNDITGGFHLVASGGVITAMRNNAGNATLTNDAVVGQTGTITGNLAVGNAALYTGAAGANVTGTVTIDTANPGMNTFNDAVGANAVTVTAGNLTFHDTTNANGHLLANGGVTTVRNIAGNVTLTLAAEVNQTGTTAGALNVGGEALYEGEVGANVNGAVVINTINAGINTLNNAANAVTLTAGNLTMNNATAAGQDVTVAAGAGNLIINDITTDLLANGGVTNVHNARDVTLTLAAVVNQSGAVNRNLAVGGGALYTGSATTDVTGTVLISTTNAGMNTIRDSVGGAAAVTVNQGNLTMRNVAFDIIVDGGNAVALVTGNVTRNVDLANAGNVTVRGNVGGTLNGAGTAIFDGTGTVTGTVGAGVGAGLTKVVVDTVGTRTFANAAWTATELNFAQGGTSDFTAADLGATNITTTTPGQGTVIVNANQTLTGNIGEIANFRVLGARNVDINIANFATNLIANAADEVTVNMGAVTRVKNLGSSTARLLVANFNTNGGAVDNVYAKTMNVAVGVAETFHGRVSGERLNLGGATSRAVFGNRSIVDVAIRGTVAAAGDVEFEGSTTVLKDIGFAGNGVALVRFADDAQFTANLSADNVYSGSVAMRKGAINVNKNITLNAPTTVASTPLTLGDKKMIVAGAANVLGFSGNNSIGFDVVANGDAVTGGQIVSQGVLEFDAATTLDIKPNDKNNARPTAGKSRSFTVISNEGPANVAAGKGLDITKVKVSGTNPFTNWVASIDGKGGLALVQQDNAQKAILDLLGSDADVTDKAANIALLTNAAAGTDAAKIVDLLASLQDSSGKLVKAKVDETLDRLPALTTVSDAIETASGAVSMGLSQRMANLAGSQGTPVQSRTVASSDAAMSGIAAGDEGARFGAWVSPFFGKTTQKERKGAAGYKNNTYGASFGFDTRANDDMIIGGAITVANNEMKHKNFKSGDKTKINSMLFSIYGMQQITDSWFAHGVATFGSNDVKNSEKRVSGLTTYDTVSGKYTSMSFNGEAMFGYNFLTEQVTFTPMAGLRYSRVNDGGYKETGSTTGQNLDVNTKASNKLEVVAGARVAGGTFGMNGMTVTPEIHGFINHDIIGKNPKQTLGLAGTNGLAVKSNKPVKTTFNVGVGVNFAYNMMEYGAGYDAEIATKRLGHQGTLKLRVNF